MNHPYVSVIVPAKNEEKVIARCLDSLLNQKTSIPYEILVIDSSSNAKTAAIAKKFPVRILYETRPGTNHARQTGVKHAKGKILCFTDADCQVPPHWIQTFLTTFNQNPHIDALFGRYVFTKSTPLYEGLSKILMPLGDRLFRFIHGFYAIRTTNFAIRKTFLDTIGGFHPSAREFNDVELGMRISKNGLTRYLPSLIIRTGDRRIRGRFFRFMKELLTNYIRVVILKQYINHQVYEDVR